MSWIDLPFKVDGSCTKGNNKHHKKLSADHVWKYDCMETIIKIQPCIEMIKDDSEMLRIVMLL